MINTFIESYVGLYKHYLFTNKEKKHYYRQFLCINNTKSVLKIMEQKHSVIVDTRKEIKVFGLPFGGTQLDVAIKLGSPACVFANKDTDKHHSITFYKHFWEGNLIITQCHFLDNELFMAQMGFISKAPKMETTLVSLLQEKYNCPIPEAAKKVCICSEDGDKILWDNDVYYTLTYLSGEGIYMDRLKQYIVQKEWMQGSRKQKSLTMLKELI